MIRRQRGFGALVAMVLLVALAGLSVALLRMSFTQATGTALDLQAARAWQASRSGIDWGVYQALKGGWSACAGASQTLDLSSESGVWVTVRCNASTYNEGESSAGTPATVTVYTIEATACNSSAGCPDNARAVQTGYVERSRQAQFTR